MGDIVSPSEQIRLTDPLSEDPEDGFELAPRSPSSIQRKPRTLHGSVFFAGFGTFLIVLVLFTIVRGIARTAQVLEEAELRGNACEVFCDGDLLKTLQLSGLFNLSKDFVDMPLRFEPSVVMKHWQELPDHQLHTLRDFVESNFLPPGSDLIDAVPIDFVETPLLIDNIKDDTLRAWASTVHGLIKILSRQPIAHVAEYPMRHTLLRLRHPIMIVPGGRFREVYYWDTYWIVKGLISVDMIDTAKQIVENLLDFAEDNSFVPNGSRRYYTSRSQPPMLTLMVEDVFDALEKRGDHGAAMNFLQYSLGILDSEYQWWMRLEHHAVHVYVDSGIYTLNRYWSDAHSPRPEMYAHDFLKAHTLPVNESDQYYRNVAATAESGWDFSNRWATADYEYVTRDIIPVDLNVILCNVESTLSRLHRTASHTIEADHYKRVQERRVNSMFEVLWSEEDGEWLDYNFKSQNRGQKGIASNYFPLWGACFKDHPRAAAADESTIASLKSSGIVLDGGVATSAHPTGTDIYQWNWPNAWAPIQHILHEGLSRSDRSDDLKAFAKEIARRWIQTTFLAYQRTGYMHEKYDATKIGGVGSGGEYVAQVGFGWTNGVVLAFLAQYSSDQFQIDSRLLKECELVQYLDCQVVF